MSQLDLAMAAGISARHLSFLETGRSKPSEGMILRLASVLDVPAREQGTLFTAAGYRPRVAARPATGLDAMPPAVAHAIRLMLDRHDPYPGLVFDHQYTVLLTNPAFQALVDATGVPFKPGENFLDGFLGAESVRSLVVNWEAAAADLVQRVRMEAWLQGPRSPLQRRLNRLVADPAGRWRSRTSRRQTACRCCPSSCASVTRRLASSRRSRPSARLRTRLLRAF